MCFGRILLSERRVLSDEAAPETLPEETDDPVLLLRLDDHALGPGRAVGEQGIVVELVEVHEAFGLGPGQELFFEESLKLLDGVGLEIPAACVGHVDLDALLDGDSGLLTAGRENLPVQCLGRLSGLGRSRAREDGCANRFRRCLAWSDRRDIVCSGEVRVQTGERASARQGLFKLPSKLLCLVPKTGRGTLANALTVEPAFYPFWAVAPAVEAVAFVLAIGRVAGEYE
jgi:hypothetical protein